MAFRLDTAMLVGLFMETLFFGVFITLASVMYVKLSTSDATHGRRNVLLSIGAIMLTIALAHITLTLSRAINAFTSLSDAKSEGAAGYLDDLSNPTFVAQDSLYVAQTVVGDMILAWRVFAVFGAKKRLLIPLAPTVAAIAALGYVAVWSFSQDRKDVAIFDTSTSAITAYLVLTMTNCILCTGAISWRIYSRSTPKNQATPIALAVAESGALYTAGIAVQLICYVAKSNWHFCMLIAITPLIGITFCLIFLQVRIHIESGIGAKSFGTRNGASGLAFPSIAVPRPQDRSQNNLPLKPVEIHISQETEYDETDRDALELGILSPAGRDSVSED